MRHQLACIAAISLLAATVCTAATLESVPSAISYQGKLTDAAGEPVADGLYNVQFKLYDVETGGTAFKSLTRQQVQTTGGFFTAQMTSLTYSDLAGRNDIWAEVYVEGATVSPRMKLLSVPFALRAGTFVLPFSGTLASSSTAFSITNTSGSAASFTGLVELTALRMTTGAAAGKVLTSDAKGNASWQTVSGSSPCWSLTGNSGTDPSSNFVGTTDDQPLEFHVNSARALRLENAVGTDQRSANVIGGYYSNSVTSGVIGGTIAGGGGYVSTTEVPNKVTDSFSTVGGGIYNRAGNDNSDATDANYATVAGGAFGVASGRHATVGGGYFDQATADYSTVAGGTMNAASGLYSAVPGGALNAASGDYSFAAGRRAKAANQGTFVWADSTNADFTSTANNQFLVRASGGVGIGTTSPQTLLDVAGTVRSSTGGFQFPDGTVQTTASTMISLPYSGSATSAVSAFHVTNAGTGSAGSFTVSSGSSSASAVSAGTSGTGNGVFGASFGSGNGIYGYNSSTGHAGKFEVDNTSSSNSALYASTTGSGSALVATSSGSNSTVNVSNNGTSGQAGYFSIGNASSTANALYASTSGSGNAVYAITTGSGAAIYARNSVGDNAAIFMGNVKVEDRTTGATALELGTGLDYAEGFHVAGGNAKPGTVLVIDPKNPGKLAVSSRAYDTRVAGIVAGANNLGSGVRLGVGEFDHNVALAGRVYCNVDATRQAVRPGDLLTTCSTPGYAMKASDRERRQGAILGKAMEPLAKGRRGQILVLVTLQ